MLKSTSMEAASNSKLSTRTLCKVMEKLAVVRKTASNLAQDMRSVARNGIHHHKRATCAQHGSQDLSALTEIRDDGNQLWYRQKSPKSPQELTCASLPVIILQGHQKRAAHGDAYGSQSSVATDKICKDRSAKDASEQSAERANNDNGQEASLLRTTFR